MRAIIVALLGYIPVRLLIHGFEGHVRKKLTVIILIIGGCIYIAALIRLLNLNLAYSIGLIIVFGIASLDGLFEGINRLYRRAKKAHRSVRVAAKKDKTWDETTLLELVARTVPKYWSDWDNKRLESLAGYTTKQFSEGNKLVFSALTDRTYTFVTKDIEVASTKIIDVHDVLDNEQDHFVVLVEGSCHKILKDSKKIIQEKTGEFIELWHFERENGKWCLDGVEDANEDEHTGNGAVEALEQNGEYYRADEWGSAFLPRQGLIGGLAATQYKEVTGFMLSIVHNFLVDILALKSKQDSKQQVVVCSLKLSKPMPHLLIRNRQIEYLPTSKLKLLDVQWPIFSRVYEVFSQPSGHNAPVEILNEHTMETLANLHFTCAIEIVNDRIYAYSQDPKVDIPIMLEVIIMLEDRLWAKK